MGVQNILCMQYYGYIKYMEYYMCIKCMHS